MVMSRVRPSHPGRHQTPATLLNSKSFPALARACLLYSSGPGAVLRPLKSLTMVDGGVRAQPPQWLYHFVSQR